MLRFLLIATLSLSIYSCSNQQDDEKKDRPLLEAGTHKDLDDILADGKLIAITTYSPTSYFLYKGQTMGFEYELLESFAKYLGVELEIIVSNDINNLFTNLNSGKADLVAHGFAITNKRKNEVNFTDYLYLTNQVLVQKKPDNWRQMKWKAVDKSLIHDAVELIGDSVSVREGTAYFTRLQNLSDEIGGQIIIDTLKGSITTAEAVDMVLSGEIKYTVADNNIAKLLATYYAILDIEVPISFSQRIGWATRHTSPKLESEINKWLAKAKDDVDYYVIYNKYFKNNKDFSKRVKSDFYSLNTNKISKFDDLIKKRAKLIHWDWRLLASEVYQESKFDPTAKSWAGAVGLMQLMPETAKELGVKKPSDPEQSILGGTTYLETLFGYFSAISDTTQRIKFTMASYNCGHGHVLDAQNLASKHYLDPLIWDNNVEKMILALKQPDYYNDKVVKHGYLRGTEPHTYVRQIFERYEHYKQFIKLK